MRWRIISDEPDGEQIRGKVVTNCAAEPQLREPIADPACIPWHEVAKVQHYWLEVDAMTKPMQVREASTRYKGGGSRI